MESSEGLNNNGGMQDNPEAFHAHAGPFVEEHLRTLYVQSGDAEVSIGDAAATSGPLKPTTLRGSGSIQAENVPASSAEQFILAFKRYD